MSCSLLLTKWCQTSEGSISQTRQEVGPTQRLQNEKAEEAIFFSLGQEETNGEKN